MVGAKTLSDEDHRLIMPPAHGFRELRGINAAVLRTFCLSLLWRAAVTSRFEFEEVTVPEADVARLGELIISGEWVPVDFYPATMIQLSTVGLIHNLSPIVQTKHNPPVGNAPRWSVEIVRFYMDGLMIHVHKHAKDDGRTATQGPIMIGGDDRLIVSTVTYEQSFKAENFAEAVAHSMFPDGSARRPASRSGKPK